MLDFSFKDLSVLFCHLICIGTTGVSKANKTADEAFAANSEHVNPNTAEVKTKLDPVSKGFPHQRFSRVKILVHVHTNITVYQIRSHSDGKINTSLSGKLTKRQRQLFFFFLAQTVKVTEVHLSFQI